MKLLITSLFLVLCSLVYSQGNLQFNQVLTLGGNTPFQSANPITTNFGGSYNYGSPIYTVPTQKVWKIESITVHGGANLFLVVNNLIVGNISTGLSNNSAIWLKESDIVRVVNFSTTATPTYFLSIIEFNIIP